MKPIAISLFSGCGGFDRGVSRAGFDTLLATDIWADACDSLAANGIVERIKCTDANKLTGRAVRTLTGIHTGELDLLFGGPPCPPYSKSRFYRRDAPRALDDPHSDTLRSFMRLVDDLKPRTFVLENVPGLAFSVHREALDFVLSRARESGYMTSHAVLNAANYGVAQVRERLFVVGWRDAHRQFRFPTPTHAEDPGPFTGLSPWVTAGQVLGSLDTEENASDVGHRAGGKHADLLRLVPPGDNYLFFTAERGYAEPIFKWRSRYWSFLLKLSPNRPSWTVQARRSNNMGPFHWRNRILRIDEIKRLQSFPDEHMVLGSVDNQWRQIGNAVPPLLAEAVASEVMSQLLDEQLQATA